MSTPGLVTIICPTYNHAGVIAESIRSAQAQTYTHWEMVILDDGSTDGTYAAAMKAAEGDARIKVFTQQNKGIFRLGENYNFMLAQSAGEFVAVLEGDDVWEPNKLELQVAAFGKQPEAVVCWGKAHVTGPEVAEVLRTAPLPDHAWAKAFNNTPTGSLLNALYFDNCIPALTLLFRRSALDRLGGFIQSHGQPLVDLPTILACAVQGPFIFIPEVLGSWRTYVNQVTKTFPVEIILGRMACVLEHCESLSAEIRATVALDKAKLQSHYDELLLIGYSRIGRYQLVRKDFSSARKNYVKSLFYPRKALLMWRLRSLVGLVFSVFHFDVEGLAKLLGKKAYR
jgi:glycosyltransferase involved in cell wall biosynthesis